jgi:hypothetical protein
MKTEGIRARASILMLVTVLMFCSLAPMANSETVTKGCDDAQCFNTQLTLYDIDENRSDFLYEINDDWYDNYTALELMTNVLDTQNMTYTTAQQNGGTVFIEVNGTTSNSSWEWAVYIDEDGMWASTSLTADHIVIKNIDNYAVCLIPYAGGEHNPFSQSVGDWLEENAEDEYIHSSGNVSSDGDIVGLTWSDSTYSMIPWTVRTGGELLGTNLTDIVMRVEGGEEGDELLSSMSLFSGTKNITHIYWWETTWGDVDGDGKFSVGDDWVVRTGQMGTHSGDYFVTFVRIGSCDWGWTVSDCPDGQICSDGTCTDENESHPMDYWAHTELGQSGHLNVTLEVQSMDPDVPITIEYRVRHDLVIDDEPHMTELGGDDIPMLTGQSTFNQTFEVEIDNGAGTYCVRIYLRLPDGDWIRPSQNHPGALSCIGIPESHWDNMTEPEPESEPEEYQQDSGNGGLLGFSLIMTIGVLFSAVMLHRRNISPRR